MPPSSAYLAFTVGCVLGIPVQAAADHYAVLGVDRGATSQQIKQAFRKLSLKWHPDMHKKDKEQAQDKFILIGAAHEVLNNATKRMTYDVYGQEGVDNDWFVDPKFKPGTDFESDTGFKSGTEYGGATGSAGTDYGHAGFNTMFGNGFDSGFGHHGSTGYTAGTSAGTTAGNTAGAGSFGQGSGGFSSFGHGIGTKYVHTGYDVAGNPTYTAVPDYTAYYASYAAQFANAYGAHGQSGASGHGAGSASSGSANLGTRGFVNAGPASGFGTESYYANFYANAHANYRRPSPAPAPPPVSHEDLFGGGLPGLEELTDTTWAEMLEDNALRRSVVVLFYRRNVAAADSLKDIFVEFGEKYAVPGIVELGVVNCNRLPARCASELRSSTAPLPVIRYYGPNVAEHVTYKGSSVSLSKLSTWTMDVMADYCQVLKSVSDIDEWLTSSDHTPKVLLFTDRRSTPPLLQALSVEFLLRASLAVVPSGPHNDELARMFGVHRKGPFALVHVLDEATLEVEHFDRELERENLSGFISGAIDRHPAAVASSVQELTAKRYEAGSCAQSDPHFCLLLLACPRGERSLVRAALRAIAQRLTKDPVKIFFTSGHSSRRSFGLPTGSVLLFRPKRQRFKAFTGDTTDPEALLEFVHSTVNAGAPLPSHVLKAMDVRGLSAEIEQGCLEDPAAQEEFIPDESRGGGVPPDEPSNETMPAGEGQYSNHEPLNENLQAPSHEAVGLEGSGGIDGTAAPLAHEVLVMEVDPIVAKPVDAADQANMTHSEGESVLGDSDSSRVMEDAAGRASVNESEGGGVPPAVPSNETMPVGEGQYSNHEPLNENLQAPSHEEVGLEGSGGMDGTAAPLAHEVLMTEVDPVVAEAVRLPAGSSEGAWAGQDAVGEEHRDETDVKSILWTITQPALVFSAALRSVVRGAFGV